MLPRHFRAGLAVLALGFVGLSTPSLTADTPQAAARAPIAVVDTQRAVMESEDGLRMRATLKKVFDERQLEIDKKQNDLQAEREQLEKQRQVLSKQELAQRAEKWQLEVAQVQQMFVEYNQELQAKQNELMQPILERALTIVEDIAKREGYVMVIDKQAVPYARADLDLTDAVIKAYNGAGATASTKPAAKK